ncbi:TPA: DUF3085 domain-containing protein [Escherichia coli]|nr:DUF3085 domain-containing protein [Escherichia coli]
MLFFDNKDLTNVLLTARMQGGQLHLAKDEGVYLMPATGAWQVNDPVPRIAYAAGCHPQKNEDWYDTARLLAGGDDFIESLTISDAIATSLLSGRTDLRILITDTQIQVLTAATDRVKVAQYRQKADQLLASAVSHFSACVGPDELCRWRENAVRLLTQTAFISCKRAKPEDHQTFLNACGRLQARLSQVTPQGALRITGR